MSQSVVPDTLNADDSFDDNEPGREGAPHDSQGKTSTLFAPRESELQNFDYRPVPILAPVTFVLGILASIGLIGIFGLLFGLMGTIVGLICIWKIRKSEGALGGSLVAWTGFVLSFLFFVGGTTFHTYTFATEVPEGYKRVNFYYDISKKGFEGKPGRPEFHPDVKALDNQKIFIKGFMYPTRQTEGIASFLLVKDSGQCCFGGQPQQSDMMIVNMQSGKTVKYRTGMVSIAGTFHCQKSEGLTGLNEKPVYALDGDLMEASRTSF